jgi:hypothetical protein
MTGTRVLAGAAGPADGRPVLRRGLVLHQSELGLLIEGTPRRQLVTGEDVDLLARLLALLDGAHREDDICAELGTEPAWLSRALEFLRHSRVIEDGRGDVGGIPEHALPYLSRAVAATGVYDHTAQAAQALAGAVVLLAGEAWWAAATAADLRESGVGTVACCAPEEAAAHLPGTGPGESRCLAAVLDDPADPAGLERVASACADRGVPVLRFARGPGFAELGPAFRRGYTACPACFRRGYEATFGPAGAGAAGGDARPEPGQAELISGLAAQEILARLAHLSVPVPPRVLTRMTGPDYRRESFSVLPERDCASCCGPAGAAGPWLSEWEAEAAPAELAVPDALLLTGHSRLTEILRPSADLHTAPRWALPATASRSGDDRARLARLLADAAGGLAPGAPPADLYLVADAGLGDLPGTVYRYDRGSGDVVSVRSDPVGTAEFLATTDLEPAGVDLVLILTAARGRLRGPHELAAVRLAHLEAGRAVMRVCAAAWAQQLAVAPASAWGPDLAGHLDLAPGSECVTAVLGLAFGKDVASCR